MFSTTPRSTRRVRVISAAVAAGAMIVAFGFTASSASAVDGGPTNSVAPVITGDLHVGGTVSVSSGVWGGDASTPYTYTYSWFDEQTLDQLSDQQTYTIDPSEAGHELQAQVTAIDTDGDSASVDVNSTDVPNLDFSNVSAPVLTGGTVVGDTLTGTNGTWSKGGLTFTYDWGIGYGNSGDELDPPDNTNSHVVTNDDFDGTLALSVTATDTSGSVQVSGFADSVTIPAPPVADDSGLVAQNEGGVTGSQTTTDATVVIPDSVQNLALTTGANVGDTLYVYGYSTATPIGFFTVSATHTIIVPLGSLSKGLHKIAIINSSGQLVGWLSVTAGGGLASTGVNVNAPLELGAAGLLILLGLLSVIFVTRSRRKDAAL
jgi:hypothetical protein